MFEALKKFKFHWNLTRLTDTCEDQCELMTISRSLWGDSSPLCYIQIQYYSIICIKHMFRTQLYLTMSSTLGIQLHVSALYTGHRQVVLKLIKELYKIRVGCPGGNEISLNTTWRWPIYRAETCSCIPNVLLIVKYSCVLTICLIYIKLH